MNTIEEKKDFIDQCVIASWSPDIDVAETWYTIEEPNWAPWLAASKETIEGRGKIFPEGQLVLKGPDGKVHALLSTNLIKWSGDIADMPNWDGVAGDPTDYSNTYDPNGNTLVLMSMSIDPTFKGLKIPSKMIDTCITVAHKLGVKHLIGSFRPSGFGQAKKELGYDIEFKDYITMVNADHKPIDPWLRSLSWKGMQMLAVDSQAMMVSVPVSEFEEYKAAYKPESWIEVHGIWECEEVGSWSVDLDSGMATYQESNVWGSLPL